MAVRNIGTRAALKVAVSFDQTFTGLGGSKEISSLPLFKNIEFLGPAREIVTLLDTSESYFKRKQPTRITARVSYLGADSSKYETTIAHDLEIYRDLVGRSRLQRTMRCDDMANSTRHDPFKNFNFLVEIDGMTQAGFSECSGLRSEVDVIEYREGGEMSSVRKLPGRPNAGDITLKRGVTTSNELQEWFESVLNGIKYRKNGAVGLLDDQRNPVVRWNFFNAFPRKWEGPSLDAKGTDVAIETLTLCCERLESVTRTLTPPRH